MALAKQEGQRTGAVADFASSGHPQCFGHGDRSQLHDLRRLPVHLAQLDPCRQVDMGHLVADPASNTVLIVGRYGNTRRLVELVGRMDRQVAAQEP